ncbi:Metallo-dependent phosphatase [Infundibulicybe gibba]|nr:Metallo-dependent phosphatase [Infundibulicybe gibba]
MTTLSILHWNDVYRVAPQKLDPRSPETIDVTQFGAMLSDLRDQWVDLPNRRKDGLVLFSGDVFSPSVESSVTRGSHMVPVMNELAPDVSLTGNHDFDFGYPHLSKLVQDTTFPWILSNIIDANTSDVPEHLHEFQIFERAGIRIGVIGLVEKEWIGTVATWPPNFIYKDMAEAGLDLSKRLRDPTGEFKCDFIIALTHSSTPSELNLFVSFQDIALAKDLLAISPSQQKRSPSAASHGVDIILGGHDHLYYVSKGVDEWDGFDVNADVLGAESDHGDVLVVKSGTDFRDLSELTLELVDAPVGGVRNKIISRITGKRHTTKAGSRSSETMKKLLETLLSSVSSALKAPVCISEVTLDVRSQFIRTEESAAGNWFADIIRHAYDSALDMQGCGGADGVLICAGTLRGDSTYGPGIIKLGDILEILPFEDPVVVIEIDGAAIWDALEASLATWPAQEGRFPVISGFRVRWDSRRKPYNRVLGIWLLKTTANGIEEEAISREIGGKIYKIVTRDYMAEGHDGFVALKDGRRLIDHEGGSLMSTIVRKYLLGSRFVNRMVRGASAGHLHTRTQTAISRERDRRQNRQDSNQHTSAATKWKQVAEMVLHQSRMRYQDHLDVCATEHMSSVDVVDGSAMRQGKSLGDKYQQDEKKDLLSIRPEVDGRLGDEGRD